MPKTMTLVIPTSRNKVLLGMKKRGFGAGRWNGFGGKVNEGETVEEAARREMLEEVGMVAGQILPVGTLDFSTEVDKDILTVHIFKTLEFSGEPIESGEMRPEWFEKENIPFEKMWPDDIVWFPLFLSGEKFKGYFIFDKDNNRVLDYKLEKV